MSRQRMLWKLLLLSGSVRHVKSCQGAKVEPYVGPIETTLRSEEAWVVAAALLDSAVRHGASCHDSSVLWFRFQGEVCYGRPVCNMLSQALQEL